MTNQEKFDSVEDYDHPHDRHDISRIVQVAKKYFDIIVNKTTAGEIWESYSRGMAASWMILPENDKEIARIINYWVYSRSGQWLEEQE